MTILNLSGIYDHESFYLQDKSSRFVDMKDISGTNAYCDDSAREEILGRLAGDLDDDGRSFARGIHFIDNGNYHYITAICGLLPPLVYEKLAKFKGAGLR